MGYYAGRKPHLLAMDAVTVQEIMLKNFAHFADNEVADMMSPRSDPIVSGNPFFQRLDQWRESRKEMAVAFSKIKVKGYHEIVTTVCGKLRSYMEDLRRRSPSLDVDSVSYASSAWV